MFCVIISEHPSKVKTYIFIITQLKINTAYFYQDKLASCVRWLNFAILIGRFHSKIGVWLQAV